MPKYSSVTNTHVLKDRASDGRLRVALSRTFAVQLRQRNTRRCNVHRANVYACVPGFPLCTLPGYACVRLCGCVFLRVSSPRCARASRKHRGRDARRRCVPNFTAEKLDVIPLYDDRTRGGTRVASRRFEMQIVRDVSSRDVEAPPRPAPLRARNGENIESTKRG